MKFVRSYQGGSLSPECHKANFEGVAQFGRNPIFLMPLKCELEVAQFERNRWLSLERNMQIAALNTTKRLFLPNLSLIVLG